MKLETYPDMGGQMNIGYQRTDINMVHVIVRAPGGSAFTVGDHFEVCPVCKHHGVTFLVFDHFMQTLAAKRSASSDAS